MSSVRVEVNQHMDSCSADTTSISIYDLPEAGGCIHDAVPPIEEILVLDERMAKTTARLEADFSKVETKILRFPRGLQGIGGDKDRYIVPTVVAIGPYHHGAPHLQKMEEVKLAAAYYLCRGSGHSTAQVYEKVRSVAGAALECYDADDPAVVGLGDAEFAAMMFLDGCFLLQYMVVDSDVMVPVLRNRSILSTGPSIQKDMFLLENQIPWLVLEVLIEFMPVDVRRFVAFMGEKFLPKEKMRRKFRQRMRRNDKTKSNGGRGGMTAEQIKPPHLLGLLWFTQVGSMPEQVLWFTQVGSTPQQVKKYRGFSSSSMSSSAVELAQMGLKLTPSTEAWFGDMHVRRNLLFGQLCLSPLFLNDVTACWLVNMVALEASTSGVSGEFYDGYTVSSYLSVLAMLMHREEDVQQLRSNSILYSTVSNKQALRFFNGLAEHLRLGQRYFVFLEAIDSYRSHRLAWVATYRFIYKYYKVIAAVMSVAGVLFSILNALYSLKKPYKT